MCCMLTGQALQRPGYIACRGCHCHNMKLFKAFQKFWHNRMACSQQSPETDICKPNMQDVFETGFFHQTLATACSQQLNGD